MASLIRSLDAHRYLRARMAADSSQAGWRSLLLRAYVDPERTEEFTTPPTADHLIVLVTAGGCNIEGRYGSAWQRAHYGPGSLGMTAPGDEVTMRWRGETQHETLQLHLPAETVCDVVAEISRRNPHQIAVPSRLLRTDPVVEAVMRGLAVALADGAPDLYAETTANFLSMHLLLRHGGFAAPGPPLGDDLRLRRAEAYMRANLAAPLSLEMVAREAGISRFHFLRLFKQAHGETPMRHLTRMRMEEAKTRLLLTNETITRIAFACGYESSAHFASAFRRQMGIAPTAYRKAAR